MKNQKFGKLLVLESADSNKYRKLQWKCVCDCGKITVVTGTLLRNGTTKSCGCLKHKPSSKWTGHQDISGAYWYQLKAAANKRKVEWDLTIEDAWNCFESQNRLCALTKLPLEFTRQYTKDKESQTASLDRIDSKFGYNKNNIQWVHKTINQMKWDMNEGDFKHWCQLVTGAST